MSITAQNRSLPDWFTQIRLGHTVLPRFQRFEAWNHSTISQLFNTIFQGLPVGAMLILEIGDKELFITRPIVGAPLTSNKAKEHLLDGQQRLTALWRGLHNNYEDRTYFLVFNRDEESGMKYYVESIARYKKSTDVEARPVWANKPKEQWQRKMIPLNLLAPGEQVVAQLRAWVREAIEDRDEADKIYDEVINIRTQLAVFNLPFLALKSVTSRETALDVFIKMNTSAAPLSTYDIVVAQIEIDEEDSLHNRISDMKQMNPNIVDYYPAENLTLYVNALLQDRLPSNSTYMERDFGSTILINWEQILKGVSRTVAFLENERIFDSARLPTDVVVPVLVALWAITPEMGDAEGRAREFIRKYLWRSFFTERYEKSTNSRSLTDFRQLKAIINNTSSEIPEIFLESKYPIVEISDLLQAGWPKNRQRLARAILALALKNGGEDIADGSTATRKNLKTREYHHLFPNAHLDRAGFKENEIFRSLNCALITWKTNRSISDKTPETYLSERQKPDGVDEATVKRRLNSHLIPYDEMKNGEYEIFLEKRASLVFEKLKQLCE
jgi:hypothetical protein